VPLQESHLISRYVGVPKGDIDFLCAGINHMAWFLDLKDRRDGRDLNPRLRECMEKPEYYSNDKVRAEVMRHFGYFMTESTGHLSEYLPWFRSSSRALAAYCDEPGFGGQTGAYYKYCAMIADKYQGVNYLDLESTKVDHRSVEYCSYILEACQTGRPFRLNGNVRNDGPGLIEPLKDLDLRLGEGTGAALAMNFLEAAVRVLTEVATFDEAMVSKASS